MTCHLHLCSMLAVWLTIPPSWRASRGSLECTLVRSMYPKSNNTLATNERPLELELFAALVAGERAPSFSPGYVSRLSDRRSDRMVANGVGHYYLKRSVKTYVSLCAVAETPPFTAA